MFNKAVGSHIVSGKARYKANLTAFNFGSDNGNKELKKYQAR